MRAVRRGKPYSTYRIQSDRRPDANIALTIPSVQIAAFGQASASLILGTISIDASANRIEPSYANITLPALSATAYGAALANVKIPTFTVSVTDSPVNEIHASVILPTLFVTAETTGNGYANAELLLNGLTVTSYCSASAVILIPGLDVTATASRVNVANANIVISNISVSATVTRQGEANATIVLPSLLSLVASANIILPSLSLSASSSSQVANAVAYNLNIHTSESTRYTGMNFLHIIAIGNQYYGVREDGLYLLDEDTNSAINGTIVLKDTDFGEFKSKHLQYVYLNSDTKTKITPHVDGVQKTGQYTGFGGRKCVLGLGDHGRYWQLKIENIKKLEGLEFLPELSQRRVK